MTLKVIVKFGGSVVTYKHHVEPTIDEAAIQGLVDTLRAWRATHPDVPLCLVHGAGSYGHPQCRQYGLREGSGHHPDLRLGVAVVRTALAQLREHLLRALVAAGLPAVAVPVWGAWETEGGGQGRILRDNTHDIDELASKGFIPVLHGDLVTDTRQGVAVLSGDTIISHLCGALPSVTTVVFLTDVDGVFTKDPKEPGAIHVREVLIGPLGEVQRIRTREDALQTDEEMMTFHTPSDDVTGAMETKFGAAAKAARAGADVYIASAANPGWPVLLNPSQKPSSDFAFTWIHSANNRDSASADPPS
eukprot:TRINITY_DN8857_c0_g1_i1.p1 TRINITY_DN8857_c0_g1~~TRINITY_DN8857_c0_g1_i1.p1  ORF type:complete len:317 (+),score=48.50 TRINITY_DN8857_c0_g1_i1:41-952(+)